jgi:hypothetical protein
MASDCCLFRVFFSLLLFFFFFAGVTGRVVQQRNARR